MDSRFRGNDRLRQVCLLNSNAKDHYTSNLNLVPPIWTSSPGERVCSVIRAPLTNVPLELPSSLIEYTPLEIVILSVPAGGCRVIGQWDAVRWLPAYDQREPSIWKMLPE